MKYVRKTVALTLVIAFFIAAVICVAVATSVRNVNVTFYGETGAYTDSYEQTKQNFDDLKGGSLITLGQNDVASCVSDGVRFNLVSFEKVYPCTVNIVLSERVETFYCVDDGVCNVYDADGVYMYSSANIVGGTQESGYVLSETNDLSPNVIIDGGLTQAERTFIAESCGYFAQSFGSLRRLVLSVEREKTPEYENLVFTLRSGIKVVISDCDSLTAEKISAAYVGYSSLTDGQKTSGRVRAYAPSSSSDAVTAVYTP